MIVVFGRLRSDLVEVLGGVLEKFGWVGVLLLTVCLNIAKSTHGAPTKSKNPFIKPVF